MAQETSTEVQRKRQYRIGLNIFNKEPENGIQYLMRRRFVHTSPQAVARFLISRKGLSRQMIGQFLGILQNSFNMAVLEFYVQEMDLTNMQVDIALRKFQSYFEMPDKILQVERLLEVFSKRYVECNYEIASKFKNTETVFDLSFAILMLNTNLHSTDIIGEKRMELEEFVQNLKSIDNLDRDMLVGIFNRINSNEFKTDPDHVTEVLKHQPTFPKSYKIAAPHRRFVCKCKASDIYDFKTKRDSGLPHLEVYLFNDLLTVTSILHYTQVRQGKNMNVTSKFTEPFTLPGLDVTTFETPYYPHGIRISQKNNGKHLITLHAGNRNDRTRFVEDLKEQILEMEEMKNIHFPQVLPQ